MMNALQTPVIIANTTTHWKEVATKDWEALVFFGGCLVWLWLFFILFWTDNFWCECLYNAVARRRHTPAKSVAVRTTSNTSRTRFGAPSRQPTSTLTKSAAERKPLINPSASVETCNTVSATAGRNNASTAITTK